MVTSDPKYPVPTVVTVKVPDVAPAGIVMAMNGASEPPLSPMTEITANAPVRLEAGSKLTFLEYGRCKLVTVTGGVLTLTPSGYNTDGHVDGEADSPCPQTYSLASSGPGTGAPTTAALVMRGGAGPPHWPVNAQLLLTGSRSVAEIRKKPKVVTGELKDWLAVG